jgi:hypothetical protein
MIIEASRNYVLLNMSGMNILVKYEQKLFDIEYLKPRGAPGRRISHVTPSGFEIAPTCLDQGYRSHDTDTGLDLRELQKLRQLHQRRGTVENV